MTGHTAPPVHNTGRPSPSEQTASVAARSALVHMWQDLQGVEEAEVSPRRPSSSKVATYLMRMGDERILAPLAAFFPDMFGLHGQPLFHRMEKFVSDPSDPNDEDYLERTMSRHELVCSQANYFTKR